MFFVFEFIFSFFNLAELADVQAEQQREMEGLLDNVRQLTRDLRLQMLVIDAFIPPEYQVFDINNGKGCGQKEFFSFEGQYFSLGQPIT